MLSTLIAQASEAGFDLGESYTLRDGTPVKEVFSTPSDIVNLIVPNLFAVAGVTIMILLIVGGYQYIAKGQKGIEEFGKIVSAILAGLVIMFGAYWVVEIIQTLTGADIPL